MKIVMFRVCIYNRHSIVDTAAVLLGGRDFRLVHINWHLFYGLLMFYNTVVTQ